MISEMLHLNVVDHTQEEETVERGGFIMDRHVTKVRGYNLRVSEIVVGCSAAFTVAAFVATSTWQVANIKRDTEEQIRAQMTHIEQMEREYQRHLQEWRALREDIEDIRIAAGIRRSRRQASDDVGGLVGLGGLGDPDDMRDRGSKTRRGR